jgi:hypothetical protein
MLPWHPQSQSWAHPLLLRVLLLLLQLLLLPGGRHLVFWDPLGMLLERVC